MKYELTIYRLVDAALRGDRVGVFDHASALAQRISFDGDAGLADKFKQLLTD